MKSESKIDSLRSKTYYIIKHHYLQPKCGIKINVVGVMPNLQLRANSWHTTTTLFYGSLDSETV